MCCDGFKVTGRETGDRGHEGRSQDRISELFRSTLTFRLRFMVLVLGVSTQTSNLSQLKLLLSLSYMLFSGLETSRLEPECEEVFDVQSIRRLSDLHPTLAFTLSAELSPQGVREVFSGHHHSFPFESLLFHHLTWT